MKLFTLTGLAVSCTFKPESQNSISRYRELHNQAQALMQANKEMKKEWNFSHSQGQLRAAASSQSLKIQALVTKSFIIRPKPWCKPKKKIEKAMKLFPLMGLAASCTFKPESKNSISRYRKLYNLAQALMQAKK
jgi:hypothetical protein